MILLVLLLNKPFESIGQTDTICITLEEAKKAWHMSERIHELDTMVRELKVALKDNEVVIMMLDGQVIDVQQQNKNLERIINNKDTEIGLLNNELKKEVRKKKVWRVATYVAGGIGLYFAIKPNLP